MNTNETTKPPQGGGSALNVELDINRLIVDIKHLRIDNAQLQYALEQSETIVDDLAKLVKRLVYQLRKAAPDNELSEKAMDYLKRKGLLGSPLREVSNAKSQATDAALSRQVACTDGLGVAVPPAPTFEQGD